MRALVKWSAWIGIESCVICILMYLLGVEFIFGAVISIFIPLFILSIISLIISPKSERKKQLKFIVHLFASCLIFFGFIIITIIYYPLLGSNIAKGITKEKILLLKIGMSKDDIIAILGDPIKIVEIKDNNKYRFIYATPGVYKMGFKFYLDLIDNKMDYLYIEIEDDFGVYLCDKKECPKIFNPEAFEELILYSSK